MAKPETDPTADLQALAELNRNAAATFQAALGELTIATSNIARAVTVLAMQNQPTRTLDERIAAVQLELEDVPRRGHADVQTRTGGSYSYDYITEADLMTGIRPLLAKNGVATYYSDEILDISNGMARVRVSLELSAAGESKILHAEGIGTDTGDKHANKAKTSAMRYLLWKTFLQPSDEDPEQENVTQTAAAGAHQAREQAHGDRQTARRTRGGAQTPEQRRGQLIQRITQLAVELDEIQGLPPGRTQAKLYDDVMLAAELELPKLDEAALVTIGTALANHVTAERAIADGGDTASAPFELPAVA